MERIIVIDFGGQYTHLIARRIRELGTYSEILPASRGLDKLNMDGVIGFILSGGPRSVKNSNSINDEIQIVNTLQKIGLPVLGICYGHQLLSLALGGKVESGKLREYGKTVAQIVPQDIFEGLKNHEVVWMSHTDLVSNPPENAEILAKTESCPIAALKYNVANWYSTQFHPEVHHTESGMKILENFLRKICRAKEHWDPGDIIEQIKTAVKREIGSSNVIMAVSGGVDSTVASYILHLVSPDNLYCIFVDNGLLRKNEAEEVKQFYEKFGFKHFMMIDASKEFLDMLKGITDPEEKRKVIAETFIRVFEREANNLSKKGINIEFLGQGTIYPDRIESAGTGEKSAKIKSHHNVALPDWLNLKVVEPLKDLYKDEVKELAKKLGLPETLINRQPFPGPSLAIRIIGEVTEERLSILREADAIVREYIDRSDIRNQLWQYFAVLLPISSVGVMGDSRTYEHTIAIRIVESKDGMTANFAKIDWDLLEKIASEIVNRVHGINRVVYDITNKPPATIEWE